MNIKRTLSLLMALVISAAFGGCAVSELEQAPPTLTVDEKEIVLAVGDTATISYRVEPGDAVVAFFADNNDIVVVDATGKVAALAAGEATVTLDAGGATKTVLVTVNAVEEEIPLQPSITVASAEAELTVGEIYSLDVSFENADGFEVAYESDNEDVATVDESGTVAALSAGSAVITVTVGEETASVALTVAAVEAEPVSAASTASQASPQPAGSSAASTSSSSSSTAPSSAPAANAANSAPSGSTGAFVGYNVTVNDKTTLATTSSSDLNYTVYTFYSASGKALGSITDDEYVKIRIAYQDKGVLPKGAHDPTDWFTEQFNLYRGLGKGNVSSGSGSDSNPERETVDTSAYASEMIKLVNKKRTDAGLDALTTDQELMGLAEQRAEELSVDFNHVGGGYGEIANKGAASPSAAIESLYKSSSHKEIMLLDGVAKIGAACYQSTNGTWYWVVLFEY